MSCRVTDVRTVHVGGSFAVGSTTPDLVSAGPTTRPAASQRRRDAQRGEHQYRAGRDRDAEAEDYDEQRILPCSNFTRPAAAAAAAAALSVLHRRQFVVLAARRRAIHFTFRRSISRRFFLSFSLSRSVITTIMVMSLIKRPVGTRLRNDSRQVVHTHRDPCAPVSKHASPRSDASGRHTARCWRWRARRGCVTALGKLFTPIMTHVPLSASTPFR